VVATINIINNLQWFHPALICNILQFARDNQAALLFQNPPMLYNRFQGLVLVSRADNCDSQPV